MICRCSLLSRIPLDFSIHPFTEDAVNAATPFAPIAADAERAPALCP